MRYTLNSLCIYDWLYSLMACVGVILLTMITPYVSKLVFSEVIPSGDATQIVPIAALLVSASLGLTMVQVTRDLVVMRIKDKMEYALQTGLMSHLLLLPTTFIKQDMRQAISPIACCRSRVSVPT